jgi:hypothetical protein
MAEEEEDLLSQQRNQIDMMTKQIVRLEMKIKNFQDNNSLQQQPTILIPPPRPLELTGDKAENLRTFRQAWTNYLIAGGIEHKTEREKIATLYCVIGSEAVQYMTNLSMTTNESASAQNILDALESNLQPEVNIIYERAMFNTAKQETNESADDFVQRLRSLIKNCRYETIEDEILRDRIVVGIFDRHLRRRLCENSNLTLADTITQLKINEVEQRQVEEYKNATQDEIYVGKCSSKRSRSRSRNRSRRSSSSSTQWSRSSSRNRNRRLSTTASKCLYCGLNRHKRDYCPAAYAVCEVCQIRGHYSSVCSFSTRPLLHHNHKN